MIVRTRYLALLIVLALPLQGCVVANYAAVRAAQEAADRILTSREQPQIVDDGAIRATILHINDVYEITAVEGGLSGGPARVATIRNWLLAEGAPVITVMGGDFFSPSAMGTARVEGRRLAGQQMVAVLNAAGLDLAVFGNHEFDLSETEFYARLAESQFEYVSTNTFDAQGADFPGAERHRNYTVHSTHGDMRIGFIGATIASNPKPYVTYLDPLETLRAETARIAGSTDVLIALTHLAYEVDEDIAFSIPEVDLILGGHEHENILTRRGADFTPIAKADANARTAWVHRLRYYPARDSLATDHELVILDASIPEDPEVLRVVNEWASLAFAAFEEEGFDPLEVVATSDIPLDGREAAIRNFETELSAIIADAMLAEGRASGADLSVYNGGSIRIDDVIPAGAITQYDVIRVLPFGGEVVTVTMPGSMLVRVLDQGVANRGTGGFLHSANAEYSEAAAAWLVGGVPIDAERTYTVATSAFLVSGREAGLDYLTLESPDVTLVATHRDVRAVVIDQLRTRFTE